MTRRHVAFGNWAEGEKIAGLANYVQPQMIDSDALFRRKIYAHRD